jgi:hypothetical protein
VTLAWTGYKRFDETSEPLLKAMHLGAFVACAGLLFHGLFDFNLHIPANALLFYILVGFATAAPQAPPLRQRK